jgi:hypothetical protein
MKVRIIKRTGPEGALMQMVKHKMLRRMWVQHQICWPTNEETAE